MKKIISIVLLILLMPVAFALGDNWLLHFSGGTTKINATDVCLSTGACLSAASGAYSWTIAGNSGSSAVASGNTVTIKGGNNISTSLSGTTLTIAYNGSVVSGSGDGTGFLTADGSWIYNGTNGLTINLTTGNATYCKLTDFNNLQGNVSTINTSSNIRSFISQAYIKTLGFNITTELKTYFDTLYQGIGSYFTQAQINTLNSDINSSITSVNNRVNNVNTSTNIASLFTNDFHNIGGTDKYNSTQDVFNAVNNGTFMNRLATSNLNMTTYNITSAYNAYISFNSSRHLY